MSDFTPVCGVGVVTDRLLTTHQGADPLALSPETNTLGHARDMSRPEKLGNAWTGSG